MSDEISRILRMLEEGKIKPEEAERLLRAVGAKPAYAKAPEFEWPRLDFRGAGMLRLMGRTTWRRIEKAIQSAFESCGPGG